MADLLCKIGRGHSLHCDWEQQVPSLHCHRVLVAALLPGWQAQSMPHHAVWNYPRLAVTNGCLYVSRSGAPHSEQLTIFSDAEMQIKQSCNIPMLSALFLKTRFERPILVCETNLRPAGTLACDVLRSLY